MRSTRNSRANYWQRKTTRRNALQTGVTGAMGAAALTLVGCGDDDDSAPDDVLGLNTPTAAAGATPAGPFAGAVKGGTLNISITGDPPVLDPYRNPATNTKLFASYVYSRLFKYTTGPGKRPGDATLTGDLAASAESSPDGLTWVVKLKPNATFHDKAPVNGRKVTTEDLKFSWERASGPSGVNRALLSFVSKAEFPDAETAKFTLKEPNAAFLDVLADVNLLWIQPKEAEGGFDPSTTAIGSGPWMLNSYKPTAEINFVRNPTWHESGFPLLDGVNVYIIPEYANVLAQFRGGSLDSIGPTADDVIELKKQFPDGKVLGSTYVSLYHLYFDKAADAPWRQQRVRQAMSMAIDRHGLNELAYNVKKLNDAGVKFNVPFNNIVPVGFGDYWLDPIGSEGGPGKKYWEYNPAAAKQLLSEAGFPNGFETTYQYTANAYGSTHNKVAEAIQGMLQAVGIKAVTDVQDYASKYYTKTFRNDFSGIAFGPETSFNEPGSYPLRLFTPNPLNHATDADAELSKLALDQQREGQPEKRKAMLKEIQRIHGERLYAIPTSFGGGPSWAMTHANVRNAENFSPRVSYVGGAEAYPYYWKASR